MREAVRQFKAYPAMSIAAAVVWGVFEFVALQRAQAVNRLHDES